MNELQGLSSTESDQLLDFVARLSPQWLAGFFDGEGCVSASINEYGVASLHVNLPQKNPSILAIISLKFPVKLSCNRSKTSSWHSLNYCGRECFSILNFIKDHVIVKKRQVELGLEFVSLIGDVGPGISESAKTRRAEIRMELKRLNAEF